MQLADQLDEAGLLPPWVRVWQVDTRRVYEATGGVYWIPEQDYRYALWLIYHQHIPPVAYLRAAYGAWETLPFEIIKSAIVFEGYAWHEPTED